MNSSSIFFFLYRGPQWFVYFILDSFEMFMNNFLWTFVFSIKMFSLIKIIFLPHWQIFLHDLGKIWIIFSRKQDIISS